MGICPAEVCPELDLLLKYL